MPPFKFSTHIEVRFRDLDALGHVNNAVYLTYFEIARLHYWKKLFGSEAFTRHSFVVVRAECNYRSPAHAGEVLQVFARVSELKRSSFIFEYEIVEAHTGRIVADGSTVQACFDPEVKRAKPIPHDLRDPILEFEKSESQATSDRLLKGD
ncbi:MAG TPA: thioesterase family protein [Terriglobia bacterium]|nr:thioesterase family protein [Terriglobia bacterium]